MTPLTDHPVILTPTEVLAPVQRSSRKWQAVAFLIAAVSDFLSFWMVLAPGERLEACKLLLKILA
jgi:hypothetical protein